ncbi:uncharacterized protein LOC106088309 [Stomoxys calcitrans]|uniref:Uncharacterized protein n=1 Tax=Stomoxys calcitrans TaxID=35570 RepID=A0A1I8PDP7_STOCA|nr:uncharacterized protein LOC106088309 [Stomoxys calcitrans]
MRKLQLMRLLNIALIIQVCSAGVTTRFKRDTYVEQNMKELIQFAKTVVNDSGPMINAVLEAMPSTAAYEKHREDLEAYLRQLNNYKSHSGICAQKSVELMVAFLEVTAPYGEQNDSSAEMKQVVKLLSENGLENLQNQAADWMENFDKAKFGEEYAKLSSQDKTDIIPIFTEIC